MPVDHSTMQLGLLPPRRGLMLPGMQHLGVVLPEAAPECHWDRAVQPTETWGMDLNDRLGDCTIAAVDHAQKVWHVNVGAGMRVMTPAELITAYSRVSGYDPADPETDRGAVWSDVLTAWHRRGFLMGGALDQTAAFVRVVPGELNELRLAVQWFGGALVGLALPLSAQRQAVWHPVSGAGSEAGSWGGHAVVITGYDTNGLTVITWGAPKRMAWEFWRRYGSEAWAVLSVDWIEKSGASPAGIALDALRTDLAEIAT